MLNILIPMAGRGSRFLDAGYTMPKPLIDIKGKPMIQWVIENLTPCREHRFIFICQRSHVEKYALTKTLNSISHDSVIVQIDGVTEGAACTALCAINHIDNNHPLMIANSDQWIDTSVDQYLSSWDTCQLDGYIMTMESNNSKWSYIQFDDFGYVKGVVEKVVVSNQATVGIYNFLSGADFCKYAQQMIDEDNRPKGEFYIAPVYQYLIRDGKKIGLYNVGKDQIGMYGLGTPEDMRFFLEMMRTTSMTAFE